MAETEADSGSFWNDLSVRFRDLEERNRLLRDRVLLIGQNMIEMKEKTDEEIIGIKKDIETLKSSMQRLVSFMETASSEFSKFARKDDLDILIRQAKMFQPLDFVRKEDLKKLKH